MVKPTKANGGDEKMRKYDIQLYILNVGARALLFMTSAGWNLQNASNWVLYEDPRTKSFVTVTRDSIGSLSAGSSPTHGISRVVALKMFAARRFSQLGKFCNKTLPQLL